LEFLARATRQKEEINGIQISKEEVKLPIRRQHDLKPNRPEKLHQKPPRHHAQLQQVAGYKINLHKLVAFLYTNNEQTEKEYRKSILFIIASKKIKYLVINKGHELSLQGELQITEERSPRRVQKVERSPMLMDW
jgi:DNA-binding LytR/AlgR family response regulator